MPDETCSPGKFCLTGFSGTSLRLLLRFGTLLRDERFASALNAHNRRQALSNQSFTSHTRSCCQRNSSISEILLACRVTLTQACPLLWSSPAAPLSKFTSNSHRSVPLVSWCFLFYSQLDYMVYIGGDRH